MRTLRSIFVLCLLASCGSPPIGPKYTETASTHKATVVIYREMRGAVLGSYSLSVNGNECELDNGSFFVSHPQGKAIITASKAAMSGTSRLAFDTVAGNVYYVKIETNGKEWMGPIAYLSMVVSNGVSDKGPYNIERIEKRQALEELKSLSQDCTQAKL